jgi:hypothetical protein
VLKSLLIALLALAVMPAAASAAIVEIEITPANGVDYGETHTVTGKVTGPYGAPLVARKVVLEARAHPFRRPFRPIAEAMTGLDGRFAFEREFDRNHEVRVLAQEFGDRSPTSTAFVFPRTSLTFRLVRRNVIRMVQTYRVPSTVRLTAPTLFYVGPRGAKRAPLAARAKTRRIRRGRFIASAVVRIPRAWRGRFRYASCFPYNGGMGDPRLGCPRRSYTF